jgi:hypothetical protein
MAVDDGRRQARALSILRARKGRCGAGNVFSSSPRHFFGEGVPARIEVERLSADGRPPFLGISR